MPRLRGGTHTHRRQASRFTLRRAYTVLDIAALHFTRSRSLSILSFFSMMMILAVSCFLHGCFSVSGHSSGSATLSYRVEQEKNGEPYERGG